MYAHKRDKLAAHVIAMSQSTSVHQLLYIQRFTLFFLYRRPIEAWTDSLPINEYVVLCYVTLSAFAPCIKL